MNLHPATTHFPIVLLLVTFLLELLSVKILKRTEIVIVIQLLLWSTVAMTVLSYLTGDHAGDIASQTFLVPEEALEKHHLFGRILLFLVPIAAICNFASLQGLYYKKTFYRFYLTFLFISLCIAGYTGYLGGDLIFTHGAGVIAHE